MNFTDTAVTVQQEQDIFEKELLGLGFKEVKLALFLLPALKKKNIEKNPRHQDQVAVASSQPHCQHLHKFGFRKSQLERSKADLGSSAQGHSF